MKEVCGIVLIYMLYFKEPVMNIGKYLRTFFYLYEFPYFMCFPVMPIFSKDTKYSL